jgi:hypothetical protein
LKPARTTHLPGGWLRAFRCLNAAWSCPDLADRFDCLNQLGALVSNSMGDT